MDVTNDAWVPILTCFGPLPAANLRAVCHTWRQRIDGLGSWVNSADKDEWLCQVVESGRPGVVRWAVAAFGGRLIPKDALARAYDNHAALLILSEAFNLPAVGREGDFVVTIGGRMRTARTVREEGGEKTLEYVADGGPCDAFAAACGAGRLATAQWLAATLRIYSAAYSAGMTRACKNGHSHVVRWLLQSGLIPAANAQAYLYVACRAGQDGVLDSLGLSPAIRPRATYKAYGAALASGYPKAAEWVSRYFQYSERDVALASR